MIRADLHKVIAHAPLIIWSIDLQGRITMSEGKGLEKVGLAGGQLVGHSVFELYQGNEEALSQIERALKGETLTEEVRIGDRMYETTYAPFRDPNGRVSGVVGFSTDVTRRWEVEQERVFISKLNEALRPLSDPREIKIKSMRVLGEHLKISRCYYAEVTEDGEHCLIDNSFHTGIGSIDGRYRLEDFGKPLVNKLRLGQVIMANNVAEDNSVTQAERDMNLQMQILAYINIPLVKDNRLLCLLGVNQNVPRDWTPLDLRLITATAERTWAAVVRARAEAKSQQSEKQFKDIIEALPQLVWVCNSAGEAIYFNEQWYKFTHAGPEDSLGFQWVNLLHADDADATLRQWQQAQRSASPLHMEFRLKEATGEFRWMLSSAVPIFDADGKIDQWFGTCTDIHDRKTFAQELEKKVQQRTTALNESNRLLQRSNDELKQFAYVSSHDMQEPLRKIQTFSSMALDRAGEADMVRFYLSKINTSAARMSALINDILQFSQAGEGLQTLQTVDLNEVMEMIKVDFELLIQQKHASIHCDQLPVLQANRLQLTQLFSNLMSNALKFSGDDAEVFLWYSLVPSDKVPAFLHPQAYDTYHYFQFCDNGIGFSSEYSEQIFKLFTRLHHVAHYKGTGIGLALCKRIVENHNGAIYASSEKGKGSTFHIYLPLTPNR